MTETIDTANLRALAEAATSGPWTFIRHTGPSTMGEHSASDDWTIFGPEERQICYEGGRPSLGDPDYIAAANPATIIALLDRLAAAEARNATLTDDAARLDFMCNAPIRMIEGNDGMWRVYEDAAPAEAVAHKWRSIVTRYYPTPREAIDAAIKARAAASISTKGGGHG